MRDAALACLTPPLPSLSSYVAELKFDGERFQLHKNGDKIHYWSRNMNDFGLRGYGVFDPVVMSQVKRDKCVLDGEMVIWHRELKQFVPFGALRGGSPAHGQPGADPPFWQGRCGR